jgi:hypothetical protein
MATNSGNRLKGTNVIAQQVDLKKSTCFVIYQSTLAALALLHVEIIKHKHTHESYIPLLFTRTTSAVQIDDVRIFPHRAAI